MKSALIVFTALVLFSCSSKIRTEVFNKMDSELRQKVEMMIQSENSEHITFVGKCTRPVDLKMRKIMHDKGILVEKAMGDIFKATGSDKEISKIASLDFIQHLQLARAGDMFELQQAAQQE